MPTIRNSIATVRALVVGLAVPLAAQPGPCDQVTAACQSAGFVEGAGSTGNGLRIDCIFPIMQGKAQPAAATRPLPQVDPQVVAACKARNPKFGHGNGSTTSTLAPQPRESPPIPTGATNAAGVAIPPAATIPTGTSVAGASTATLHYPDKSLPALTAPAGGTGSLAIEMESISGVKTPLGNASAVQNNGATRTVVIQFAKGDQQAKAIQPCFTAHCVISSLTITQMAHPSGSQPTPVIVYILTEVNIRELLHAPCAGPLTAKPCEGPLLASVGYQKINVQYSAHPSH